MRRRRSRRASTARPESGYTNAPSFLTAWPDTAAQPLASDQNWTGGMTVPNLAVVQVGPTGKIDLYNAAGTTDVVIDVAGWYQ